MSDLIFDLQDELLPWLREGDIEHCGRIIVQRLADLPKSPFHIAIDLKITNDPAHIAVHFDRFFQQEWPRFGIGAAYTEMNGFDINPDRWFFDVFAFSEYGGQDDYDWLSDWQSEAYPDMTITGLEQLQRVYEAEYGNGEFQNASDVAALLVVTKFQDLIRRAATLMSGLHFPLLATAHDYYDFIYEAGQNS